MRQLLKNRYRVLQVLSETGGFAQTFLGEVTDMPSRRRCVIKKLRPLTGPEDLKCAQDRFEREAAILERLGDASDQIPKLYAYFVEDQEFYLVQEFVEGPTLRQIVQQGTPLDEKTVVELIVALLDVLSYVHQQNVIHRDIKPDNVILRRRDNKPVLIDFGIVKEVLRNSDDGSATHSLVVGTPGYISPEQAAGQAVFASDLYSLGVTAIFLLTGKNPRRLTDSATGKINWRPHAPGVSGALAAILDKSTQMYLPDRYQIAERMSEDLRNAESDEETLIKPCVIPSSNPEPQRRNYSLYLAIAATVFSLLAVLGNIRLAGKPSAETARQSVNKEAASQSIRRQIPTEVEVPGRFPEASTRLLATSDLAKRMKWDLRIMRNEIFARHGYIFKSADMQNYFARQHWYSPLHNDVSGLLSDIETRNVKMLRSSE